jgi:pilus assembly protein Flp/PilA
VRAANNSRPAARHERVWHGPETLDSKPNLKRSKNQMLKKFFRDETGLELSEYAVAAALIALATVTAFSGLGTTIKNAITNLSGKIPTAP